MVFLTVSALIKGAPCQNKYKAVLLEIFNDKFMLHVFLSIFFIFTSSHCNPRYEMKSEEEVVEFTVFLRQQPDGSLPEVVTFTVSKTNQCSLQVQFIPDMIHSFN